MEGSPAAANETEVRKQIEAENQQLASENARKLKDKWKYRTDDIERLTTLILSQSNIYLHGPNGTGKTTFVQDVMTSRNFQCGCIYVDTVEFFSEKLISIIISQEIDLMMKSQAKQLRLPKSIEKKLSFKLCQKFNTLQEALCAMQETVQRIKVEYAQSHPKVLGLRFFFYVVLDNIKSVLAIERQKKILEKLAITQSLVNSPSCFSILAINDCLIDEQAVFKNHTNVFSEYFFTSLYFKEANEDQLKHILWGKLAAVYPDCVFLPDVFDNYFRQLSKFFQIHTFNINELEYLFRFLYPRYIQKYYDVMLSEEKKLDPREVYARCPMVDLFDKSFKGYLKEIEGSMFMHVSSSEDIEKEVAQRKEDERVERVKQQQKAWDRSQGAWDNHQLFEYDSIQYLQGTSAKQNFSYIQSIVLIAAFIAGSNKESSDVRLFDQDRTKLRGGRNLAANTSANNKQGVNLVGKTKRFSLDRLISIVDYLSSLEIEGSTECQRVNHSCEYYSCINTLAKEELLKKQVTRVGGSSGAGPDDLVNISLKCNYDLGFVTEVAKNINFRLDEYLFMNEIDE